MVNLTNYIYQIGRWRVDCAKMTVSNSDGAVQLSAKVFELLKLFIHAGNKVVSKEDAIESVWDGNVPVGTTGFPNAVWHLRKAFSDLGAENDEVIETIQTKGYQLVLDVEEIIFENDSTTPLPFYQNKKKVAVSLSVLSLLILISFVFMPLFHSNPDNNSLAIVNKRVTNYEGIEEQPSISVDGKYLAFRWRPPGSPGHIYIKNLVNEDAGLRKLTTNSQKELSPVWSPDGDSIAYMLINNEACEVHIFDIVSNEDKFVDNDCFQKRYQHGLDWSSDGKHLIYTKLVNDQIAIFKRNLNANITTQITRPKANEEDIAAVFVNDENQIAYIRNTGTSQSLMLWSSEKSEENIITNDVGFVGLAWDQIGQRILFTQGIKGKFVISAYDLNSEEVALIDAKQTPGSIVVNEANGDIVYSRHAANEYIEEISLQTGEIIKRVSSSSRDLYGQHVASNDSILFTSNRSGEWQIWLKEQYLSTQITHNQGPVTIPTVSPDGTRYALTLTPDTSKHAELFVGSLIHNKELIKLPNIGIKIQSPNWSQNDAEILFSGFKNKHWGIHSYNFNLSQVQQLTSTGERFAVQASEHIYFVTRYNQKGIWRYNTTNKQFIKVVDDLAINDYGNYFWKSDALYFVKRTDKNDLIVKVEKNGQQETVLSLPSFTIRSYRGISPAANDNILISKHNVNDSDIYALTLQ